MNKNTIVEVRFPGKGLYRDFMVYVQWDRRITDSAISSKGRNIHPESAVWLFNYLKKSPEWYVVADIDDDGETLITFRRIEYDYLNLDSARDRYRNDSWRRSENGRKAMRFLAYLIREVKDLYRRMRYFNKLAGKHDGLWEFGEQLDKHIIRHTLHLLMSMGRWRWYAEVVDMEDEEELA